MEQSQQFSLRWNNYLRHIQDAFDSLRTDEDLVDVTLSCEGKKIRAHKMLLSACSTYFKDLFKENPCQHPVIIFKDVRYHDLEALVNFMYKGEVNVLQEHLTSFLNTAELLSIQGLSDGSSKEKETNVIESFSKEVKASGESVPSKPEVKHSSSTPSSAPTTTNGVSISASVSTTSVTQSSPGSPAVKKRKCVSGASSTGLSVSKVNNDTNLETITSDCESMEVIPVVTNVKTEKTDYFEEEHVSGPHFSDKTGISDSSNCVSTVIKEEKSDDQHSVHGMNNADNKFQHSSPLLDLNHVMGASGPSLDMLSQEPLQDAVTREDNGSPMKEMTESSKPSNVSPHEELVIQADVLSSSVDVSISGDSVDLFNTVDQKSLDSCQSLSDASGLDFYYGCDICKESKLSKKESGCPRCPICANFSAPCSHLLKIHMKDIHGWFTVQRRFNNY